MFPYYLAIGMTYEQYWEGDSKLVIAYREAYKLRRKTENENAWLQGLYFYDAFAVVMSKVFSKHGAKQTEYLQRPLDIFPLTEEEKKQREAEENAKIQRVMEEMARRQRLEKQKGDG